MSLRKPTLAIAVFGLCSLLPAQKEVQGNPDTGQGGLTPEQIERQEHLRELQRQRDEMKHRQDSVDYANKAISEIPKDFGVRVMVLQEPDRIPPGGAGTLILHVLIPKSSQTKIRPGGRVEFKADKKSPLRFGAAEFDAPKKGAAYYNDSFLIRLPVTVQNGVPFKQYGVLGTLHLSGDFTIFGGGGGGPDDAVDAQGRKLQEEGELPPEALLPEQHRSSAQVPIGGGLNVGPPVPNPAFSPKKRRHGADPAAKSAGSESSEPKQSGKAEAKAKPGKTASVGPDGLPVGAGEGPASPESLQDPEAVQSGVNLLAIIPFGLGILILLMLVVGKKRS